jgi:hypothetical protein
MWCSILERWTCAAILSFCCICMYVYVYMHIHIYVYMYVYVRIHVYNVRVSMHCMPDKIQLSSYSELVLSLAHDADHLLHKLRKSMGSTVLHRIMLLKKELDKVWRGTRKSMASRHVCCTLHLSVRNEKHLSNQKQNIPHFSALAQKSNCRSICLSGHAWTGSVFAIWLLGRRSLIVFIKIGSKHLCLHSGTCVPNVCAYMHGDRSVACFASIIYARIGDMAEAFACIYVYHICTYGWNSSSVCVHWHPFYVNS